MARYTNRVVQYCTIAFVTTRRLSLSNREKQCCDIARIGVRDCASPTWDPQSAQNDCASPTWDLQSAQNDCASQMWDLQSAQNDCASQMWDLQSAQNDCASQMWDPQSAQNDCASQMWDLNSPPPSSIKHITLYLCPIFFYDGQSWHFAFLGSNTCDGVGNGDFEQTLWASLVLVLIYVDICWMY